MNEFKILDMWAEKVRKEFDFPYQRLMLSQFLPEDEVNKIIQRMINGEIDPVYPEISYDQGE